MSKDFMIDWVRHAESCSNIKTAELTNLTSIKNIPKPFDYENEFEMIQNNMKTITTIPSVFTNMTDDLSNFVHTIYSTIIDESKNIHTKLLQKTSHPPLSFKGINQAILLGLNKFNNFNYDNVYCSPTARTIMTALFSLRTVNYNRILLNQSPIKIIIIPCITEELNYASKFDNQNTPIPLKFIESVIHHIKSWLHSNYFEFWKDIEFINLIKKVKQLYTDKQSIIDECNNLLKCHVYDKKSCLKILISEISKVSEISEILKIKNNLSKFLDPRFFTSCEIDYTLSDYGENYNSNMSYFYTYIKKTIKLDKELIKILCFSHGLVLKNHFRLRDKLNNTEMIREYYPPIQNIYKPSNILGYIEDISEYNEETCGAMCGNPNDNKMFHVINKLSLGQHYYSIHPKYSSDM